MKVGVAQGVEGRAFAELLYWHTPNLMHRMRKLLKGVRFGRSRGIAKPWPLVLSGRERSLVSNNVDGGLQRPALPNSVDETVW